MHTEASIDIDRPIEQVFELTNNHVAEWSDVVVENEMLDETPNGVGSTFRSLTKDPGGREMEFQGIVTKYDPPHANAIYMAGGSFDLEVDYTFKTIPHDRTRVTQHSSVTGKGFFKVVFFLFGWMMKKSSCNAIEKELRRLKGFCESKPIK